MFRTEHAQIPGYPLLKDHWLKHTSKVCKCTNICIFLGKISHTHIFAKGAHKYFPEYSPMGEGLSKRTFLSLGLSNFQCLTFISIETIIN